MTDHVIKRTIEEVTSAWEESASAAQMAKLLGVKHHTTAQNMARTHGLEVPAPHWGQTGNTVYIREEVEREYTDEEMLCYLENKGYMVVRTELREDREHEIETTTFDGNGSFKVGVVSDTHAGSRYQQQTFLCAAYDEFERLGIEHVIHGGDATAGSIHMHPGMVYEQFVQGADQQADYTCSTYPCRPGITTHIISGNHDHSHFKAGGVNIVKKIAAERDDFNYLGMSGAYLTINGIRFYIQHPSGGVPYARSWRLQKVIEQMSPAGKPNVLIVGHLHVTAVLESYRNVYGFLAGCFESQTPYLREKGVHPEVGFSVLEVTYDDEGAVRYKKEWIPCYNPKDDDY